MSDSIFITRPTGPYEGPERENGITAPGEAVNPGNSTMFDSEIDLREELNTFIDNRGHKVIFRRITTNRCPNWSEALKEEHSKRCKWCAGTGYIYQEVVLLEAR